MRLEELTGTLSTQEWDLIGAVLGDRPYKDVANIITKLNSQFASQRTAAAQPVSVQAQVPI